jgi:hypothetical protein
MRHFLETRTGGWLAFLMGFFALHAAATTYYVNQNNPNPAAPYTSWATAATNIQDACFVATASRSVILVTNGIYEYGGYADAGSNRVNPFGTGISIQSVNGPALTIIEGSQVPGTTNGGNAVRCVFLTSSSVLSGFTLTNGATENNGYGGGVYAGSGCLVSNCIISGNAAGYGGGCYGANDNGALVNCQIIGNSAINGGTGGGAYGIGLTNCLLTGNVASYRGGAAANGTLVNCTIVTNIGLPDSLDGCLLKNCISDYNYPDNGEANGDGNSFSNCCVAVTPTFNSANNITNPPAFVDMVHGNYQLQIGSPCMDAGNNSFVAAGTDLNGNPRIVGAAVDLGCYENQNTNPVHYVSLSSTNPVAPYTNWPTASTNIQNAIAIAQAGDVVVANSGAYTNGGVVIFGTETNRVALTNGVTLIGVNGSASTFIVGGVQTRCIYVGSNSTLMGFTLTQGATRTTGDMTNEESGGGAWCQSRNSLVQYCTVISNNAFLYGGGVYSGTLSNSLLMTNVAKGILWNYGIGGGAHGSVLHHCILAKNYAFYEGGGADSSALDNCMVSNNALYYLAYGAGVCNSSVTNCVLIGNNGGTGAGAYASQLYDCLIISNSASTYGGGANDCILNNCTIAKNYAYYWGGGVGGIINEYGSIPSTLNNCVLYYNTIGNNSGALTTGTNYFGDTLNYCCTWPLPTNGVGNITNAPWFVNLTNNFHLQSNSPCINAGNNAYVTTANDLDGNSRIIGDTVDMGAYEYPTPTSVISYAYLQQYGLPTDGTVDFADLDGTAFNVYQDWIAGLNPTNSASVLAMLTPADTVNTNGITVMWQSVTNILYNLQRSTNLFVFTTIQPNIIGQTNTTSYTDTSATNNFSYLYRVGVTAP